MGVPKFYRWLSERYPLINQKIGDDTQFLPVTDNAYFDLNGIIHTCTHPNDDDVHEALSMKDMILGMFSYIDRMVQIIKPQKVIVLAVDGCAPRAKMNQQRSRRFAAAKDRREATQVALENGDITEDDVRKQFDSNCITPGTEFMDKVSENFQYFVQKKIKDDPLWRKLKIVYSGHDVPGEGEHKIMDYIRHTRMQPGYDPNTRHCLCGLDADLIMLGLASHEPHFALLREVVDFNAFANSRNKAKSAKKEVKKQVSQDKWQLLHVKTLRQYLDLEFSTIAATLPFKYNLERVIDDWVLMSFFVGNDFLPHLPSLDIGEGALDELFRMYKDLLPTLGGYLAEDGVINFARLEKLLRLLGDREEDVLHAREKEAKKRKKRERRHHRVPVEATEEQSDQVSDIPSTHKAKYYSEKFGIQDPNSEVIQNLKRSYIEGLQWCFRYYYHGVESWTWYFPFHYAPMASDLTDLAQMRLDFNIGQPFKPFLQLLSCLPADSAWCLPKPYRELMTHTKSPIADFYPREFRVDMNGKRNPWEGVNLLPFIDEVRLKHAVTAHCPDNLLTEDERRRNSPGQEFVFEFDPSNLGVVRSPFPAAGLKDIPTCQSRKRTYTLPPMAKFSPNLLEGTVDNAPYPGDPQLRALPLDLARTGLAHCHVNTFGRESKKETLVLRLEKQKQNQRKPLEEAIEALKRISPRSPEQDGPTVWVNYPCLHESVVEAVATTEQVATVSMRPGATESGPWWTFDVQPQSNDESLRQFKRDAILSQTKLLGGAEVVGTGGLDIGKVEVMLLIRPLSGMAVDPVHGSSKQLFAQEGTWVPFQVAVLANHAPDTRFIPTGHVPLDQRFETGSVVMCLGKNGYGQVGSVDSITPETNEVVCRFGSISPEVPPFGHTIATTVVEKYIPSHRAAKSLGISTSTLGKVMGSLRVSPGRHDIGLNLRVGKGYMTPGYTRVKADKSNLPAWSTGRSPLMLHGLDQAEEPLGNDVAAQAKSSTHWEYTKAAIDLVTAYKKKFPQVFHLVERHPHEREYEGKDMFGNNWKHDIEQVVKWLQQLDTFTLPLVPVSSEVMSRAAVKAVEKASDSVVKQLAKQMAKAASQQVLVSLPAEMVFRCKNDSFELHVSPSTHVPPLLGDRVENLCNPMIPFGLVGTVVATHPSTGCVEVVFDKQFVGGDTRHGTCSPGRGKLLLWSQLLNLSKRAPVAKAEPTSLPEQPWGPTLAAPAPYSDLALRPATPGKAKAKSKKPLAKPVAGRAKASGEALARPVAAKTKETKEAAPAIGFAQQAKFQGSDDLAKFWEELQVVPNNGTKVTNDSQLGNELMELIDLMDKVGTEEEPRAVPTTKPKKKSKEATVASSETRPVMSPIVAKQKPRKAKKQHVENAVNKPAPKAILQKEKSEEEPAKNAVSKPAPKAILQKEKFEEESVKSAEVLARPVQQLAAPAMAQPPPPHFAHPPLPVPGYAMPPMPQAGYPMAPAGYMQPPPPVATRGADSKLAMLDSLILRARKTEGKS